MGTLGTLGTALGLVALPEVAPPVVAQGPGDAPLAVAGAVLAAVNAGDAAALAALSSEATTLEILPGPAGGGVQIRGREAVLGIWRQAALAGLQARPVGPPRAVGGRVQWTLRFTDRELRARGQASQATLEATITAGRIEALTARVTGAIPLALFEALPGGVGLPRTGAGAPPGPGPRGAAGAALALSLAAAGLAVRRAWGLGPLP
jgi:hypothetical protein